MLTKRMAESLLRIILSLRNLNSVRIGLTFDNQKLLRLRGVFELVRVKLGGLSYHFSLGLLLSEG